VIDVRDGFAAYMRRGNRQSRVREVLRQRRLLEREHGQLDFVFDARNPGALELLMTWKSAQYERSGIFDRFSRRWVRDLVWDLAACERPGCRGVLSTLSAGGQLVAVHFGVRSGARLSLWFAAYDRDLRRCAPGLQLYFLMTEAAPQHGIGLLDLGAGDEAYKSALASWEYPAARGRVQVDALAGLIRRARSGSERRIDRLVVRHPRLQSHLPRWLSRVDRVH
ncbi:MAG: GNAT family N-acetyltransferase, partial [Candidatus Dormiibacterota bacterium]